MKLNISSIKYVALSATLYSASAAAQKGSSQPNVLLFVVDDWGAHDLSLTGSKLYETHNIDNLAKESTTFSQAYVAYPRSVPSRYSLFTGRHCARPQSTAKNDDRKVDAQSYCIAMPFKDAGYETFFIGKWHLSDNVTFPQDKGFDINIGGGKAGSTSSYFPPYNKNAGNDNDKLIYDMDDALEGEYLTDYMIRKTVDYIQKPHEKPFFAVCSFYAVHTPIQAKKDITDKYNTKIKSLGLGSDPMMLQEAGDCKTQQDHPVYAAMIESVDEGIGNVIKTLKENNLYDNTIIVLISDHGGLSNRGNKRELATTNYPLKAGKGHLYEGGVRVPMLIHGAGQKRSYNMDVPVASYDILPTLADMCNLKLDNNAELDGINISSLVNGKKTKMQLERDLFWHKVAERPTSTGDYVSSAIRSGNYKLIDFYRQGRVELYDLKSDPGESNNIAKSNPEMTKAMLSKLNNFRESMSVNMKSKISDENIKQKKRN